MPAPKHLLPLLLLTACGRPYVFPDEPQALTQIDFEQGMYRAWRMQLADEDLDGDGTIDHTLPAVLDLMGLLLDDPDATASGMNMWLDKRLADGDLVVLVSSEVPSGLRVEHSFLGGILGSDDKIYVDPDTVDHDGEPFTVVEGSFVGTSTYEASADLIYMPVTLFEGQEAATLAVEQVQMEGTLTDEAHVATLQGALPTDLLWSEVASVMEDGYDINHDGIPEFSLEELAEIYDTVMDNPGMAPVDLGEGRKGISAVFQVVALPGELEEGSPPENEDTGI